MGGDELSVINPGLQGGPKLAEGGRGAHVLPSEAMDPGKHELRFGRPDEERLRYFDPAPPNSSQAYRTGAVTAVIGGFEVDRDKGDHGDVHEATSGGSVALAWEKCRSFLQDQYDSREAGENPASPVPVHRRVIRTLENPLLFDHDGAVAPSSIRRVIVV